MSLPYKNGTWFTVPLRQGGFATGIVARHVSKEGKVILAYFFGPKRDSVPKLEDVHNLTSDLAIKIARVGDLGLIDGSWQILGNSLNWKKEEWPMPVFARQDEISKTAWRMYYSDHNPNELISEERIPYNSTGYERNALLGAGAAEIVLTRLLA
jgi:hypothetical protein